MVHQHVLIASDVEMSIVADPGKAKAIQSRVCNQNCPSFPNKNTSFRIPPDRAHATFVLMYTVQNVKALANEDTLLRTHCCP